MTRLRSADLLKATSLYAGASALAVLIGLLIARGHYYLVAAGVLGVGLAVVFTVQALEFRAITWWVVAGVVAYPFLRYPTGHSQLTFDRVWILGLAGALAITPATIRRHTAASRNLAIAVGALAAAMLLRGLLTTPQRSYAVGLALDSGVLPAIVFFGARRLVTTRDRVDRLLKSLVIAGAILGLIACAERLVGFELATLSGGSVVLDPSVGIRVSGPYANDDVLAVALLMCLAATIMWTQLAPSQRLKLGLLVILLEVAGITFTFFRGAWIAALVVVVVGVGLRPRRYARLAATVGLVAVVAGVLFLRAQDASGLDQRLGNTQNVSGRVATYEQAIELFELHPLDGVGIGQFANAQQTELPSTEVGGVEDVSTAHDSFLDSLAEGGLLMSIPFVCAIVAAVMMIRRFRKLAIRHPQDVLLGAMIVGAALAYLLMSVEETVITSSTASNAFIALLLGTCAAQLDVIHEEDSKAAGHSALGAPGR
jgi:O-antigen ligase/polysaccharide polymerase Wzy-like membrane protein